MPGYKFILINDPSGTSTVAYGLNDLGQIVGQYNDGSGPQGFLFSQGNYTTLNDPATSFFLPSHVTVATGINGAGQIVGRAGDLPGSIDARRHRYVAREKKGCSRII